MLQLEETDFTYVQVILFQFRQNINFLNRANKNVSTINHSRGSVINLKWLWCKYYLLYLLIYSYYKPLTDYI